MKNKVFRLFAFLLIMVLSLSLYADWIAIEKKDIFGVSTSEYYLSLSENNIGYYSTELYRNMLFEWDCKIDRDGYLTICFFGEDGKSLINLSGTNNSELSVKLQDVSVKKYPTQLNSEQYK